MSSVVRALHCRIAGASAFAPSVPISLLSNFVQWLAEEEGCDQEVDVCSGPHKGNKALSGVHGRQKASSPPISSFAEESSGWTRIRIEGPQYVQ
jgi:hypothetical protein